MVNGLVSFVSLISEKIFMAIPWLRVRESRFWRTMVMSHAH